MERKSVENNEAFEIQQGSFWNITSKFLISVWGEVAVFYRPSILKGRIKLLRLVA